MTRRVFAWQTDSAGCFWYRIYLPLSTLNTLPGWECRWGAPGPDIADYDVVIGQRLAGASPEWMELCRNPNVLTVYDADDDLTDLDPENTVPYSIYAPLADQTRELIAAADVVTTATPQTAQRLARINPRVVVLPICIPQEMIGWPVRRGPDAVTVGWSGSPFHHQDWQVLPPILAEYARMTPRAGFHMIGADYTAGQVPRLRTTGWSTVDSYYRALDFDIGLAPLNPALRGSQTRSYTKVLEYAARGIPCLASACGQFVDWVVDGVNGLLVYEDFQWLPFLVAMSDDTTRAAMSTAAREQARLHTIEANIHRWVDVYSGKKVP